VDSGPARVGAEESSLIAYASGFRSPAFGSSLSFPFSLPRGLGSRGVCELAPSPEGRGVDDACIARIISASGGISRIKMVGAVDCGEFGSTPLGKMDVNVRNAASDCCECESLLFESAAVRIPWDVLGPPLCPAGNVAGFDWYTRCRSGPSSPSHTSSELGMLV